MRIELNLASRPIVNRRRVLVLGTAAFVVLLGLAIFQAATYARNWGSGRAIAENVARLESQSTQLQREQKQLEDRLKRPDAVQVLDLSYFLNSLIIQKSFSWTQTFMDLEKIVPDDVLIVSLRPEVLEPNRVRLDLVAIGKSPDALLDFVRRLEQSDKFSEPLLRQYTPPPPTTTPAGPANETARLTFSVIYVQK